MRLSQPLSRECAVKCAPGAAKKACANCTCGRAEAEAKGKPAAPVKLTQDMLDNPTSSCGSVSISSIFMLVLTLLLAGMQSQLCSWPHFSSKHQLRSRPCAAMLQTISIFPNISRMPMNMSETACVTLLKSTDKRNQPGHTVCVTILTYDAPTFLAHLSWWLSSWCALLRLGMMPGIYWHLKCLTLPGEISMGTFQLNPISLGIGTLIHARLSCWE